MDPHEARLLLESVRNPKPEKFASDEDQESWYLTCRLLGDLYLRELDRPASTLQLAQRVQVSAGGISDHLKVPVNGIRGGDRAMDPAFGPDA